MSKPKSEFDAPWKGVLDLYFRDFIALCWPSKYSEINWEKGVKSLDKELNKIARNAPVTNRVADKLMEVTLNNDKEIFVLVHIEVQGQYDKDFEERMFVYRYRLRDLYKKPIASLAVLIDANPNWRPSIYHEGFWESSVEMKFPVLKIIDFKPRIKELELSSNPFSTVVLAQLIALEKQSFDAKLISKVNLIKNLYQRGWQKEDIINLLIFIDWLVALPPQLEVKYRKMIVEVEEELHVSYVTSFERMGIDKGRQEGIQQGLQQGVQQGESTLLLRLLEHKFKTIPNAYKQKIEQATPDNLLKWGEKVLDVQSLEDVFKD